MLVIQSVGTALHMDVATTLCLVVRFNCKAFHSHLFCFIKLPQSMVDCCLVCGLSLRSLVVIQTFSLARGIVSSRLVGTPPTYIARTHARIVRAGWGAGRQGLFHLC